MKVECSTEIELQSWFDSEDVRIKEEQEERKQLERAALRAFNNFNHEKFILQCNVYRRAIGG